MYSLSVIIFELVGMFLEALFISFFTESLCFCGQGEGIPGFELTLQTVFYTCSSAKNQSEILTPGAFREI